MELIEKKGKQIVKINGEINQETVDEFNAYLGNANDMPLIFEMSRVENITMKGISELIRTANEYYFKTGRRINIFKPSKSSMNIFETVGLINIFNFSQVA